MAEFNVPEVNASGEFVSPLVKSHVQELALSVSDPGEALADAKAYTDAKTTPTELGTQHLDTVEEPGDYMQSENAEALTETGYPVPIAGSLTVTANRTRNIVLQQYRTYRAIENGRTWSRVRYLGNWSAWAVSGDDAAKALTDAKAYTDGRVDDLTYSVEDWTVGFMSSLAPITSRMWSGPGRPDQLATTGGVLTGMEPVGAEYRSTDGAGVGAWVWTKRPNGWVVTSGDTGWRALGRWSDGVVTEGNVPASLGPLGSASGGIFLRRVNAAVTLAVVEGLALQANPEIPNIAGFRGNVSMPYPAIPLYYRLHGGAEEVGNIDVGASLYRLRVPEGAILASRGSGGYGVQGTWTTGYVDWPITLPGTPS